MASTVRELTPLLEVFDLPASVAFYRDILGFDLVSGDDTWWCMLRLGGATLMLNTAYEINERPPSPEPNRVRGHADTSLYLGADNPEAVYADLRSKGWPATEPTITTYGMKQTSTRDPDGFRIFFIAPSQPAGPKT